jgi:predicted DNA-binding protein YlxM (UPF0122 family)
MVDGKRDRRLLPADRKQITSDQKEYFFSLLGETYSVRESCRKSGISLQTAYNYRNRDSEFAERWEEALLCAKHRMEEEIFRRGAYGWDEPVWYKGKVVGKVRKHSDNCAFKWLEGNWPEKYGRQQHINLTSDDGTMTPVHVTAGDVAVMVELREMYKRITEGEGQA